MTLSNEALAIVRLLHLAGFLFMAAPLYMLVVVNERARFAVPPGYNTDRYMENIIKAQPIRCYVFLGTVLVTGLLLTGGGMWGWEALINSKTLIVKWVVTLVLVGILSYVHLGIQPKVEALLAPLKPGENLAETERAALVRLRTRRKRLASVCLFLVLTGLIMGVRLLSQLNVVLTVVVLVLAALFAWRVYRTPIRYGWF